MFEHVKLMVSNVQNPKKIVRFSDVLKRSNKITPEHKSSVRNPHVFGFRHSTVLGAFWYLDVAISVIHCTNLIK